MNVLGISINGKTLPIEQEVFQLKNVIESGAGATFLVLDAYNIVKSEIVKYFVAIKLTTI